MSCGAIKILQAVTHRGVKIASGGRGLCGNLIMETNISLSPLTIIGFFVMARCTDYLYTEFLSELHVWSTQPVII